MSCEDEAYGTSLAVTNEEGYLAAQLMGYVSYFTIVFRYCKQIADCDFNFFFFFFNKKNVK